MSNWRIRLIRRLTDSMRRQDDFKLRLGHSLALQNPDRELYMEIVYGDEEETVFDVCFEPATWDRIRNSMQEMQWHSEKEYEEVRRNE